MSENVKMNTVGDIMIWERKAHNDCGKSGW